MNDPIHLKLIEFLSFSLNSFVTEITQSKHRKTSKKSLFQLALIGRIHERSDALLVLLDQDRDHSIAELVRAVLEAHAALHFLTHEHKATFRLELESNLDAQRMLSRAVLSGLLTPTEEKVANRSVSRLKRRQKVLKTRGIHASKKSDRVEALGPLLRLAYSLLSAESHHDLRWLSESHFDVSNDMLQVRAGDRHSDRTLIIYVAVVLQAIAAAVDLYANTLVVADHKHKWRVLRREQTKLIAEFDTWGKEVIGP